MEFFGFEDVAWTTGKKNNLQPGATNRNRVSKKHPLGRSSKKILPQGLTKINSFVLGASSRGAIDNLKQWSFNLPSRSLAARPWKMMGLEDDPFLLGFGNFSGENSLLNFRGVPSWKKTAIMTFLGCENVKTWPVHSKVVCTVTV